MPSAMSSTDIEKPPSVERIEDIDKPEIHDVDYDEEFTPAEQRRIIHRVDRRLVTMAGLAYCISLMDRTNLSMAAVAGMTKDLQLGVGTRYSVVILVFFIPYVVFQPPMTVIIRKVGPTLFLGTLVISWGAILVGMGFVKNWKQMVAIRVLLGALEAGYFPGCVYLLSSWYARYDIQKRYSVFYLIGCVASALAGVLAFGLMQMGGIQGISGWRWIFIMEGVITGAIGLLTFVFMVDFPEKAHKSWKFLNERESAFIVRRINRDRADGNEEPFTFKRFFSPALDLKIWGFALICLCSTTVAYAIAYFLPIILQEGMGFSTGASQCLVAPPYGFAGIVMYTTAWISDRYRMRGPIVAFNAVVGIIGLPLMGFAKGNAARYVGVFLVVAGANSNIPAVMAYQANNIRGQWTRAFCSATLIGVGAIGGIVSSLVFQSKDAPEYRPGIWTTIACNLITMITVAALSVWFRYANKQADRGERVIEGSADFRYTI
ncbi:major facilitator superfamily domain-containing protein [Aspergillus welwitschiae]|uniref:Major facilitator superfamily domain-containing protein n=1 Tax=Aspergillus welwitschiae TaxID=1341132 RepID=A0A3F3PKE5_9EURO|nr:major facilitator superfamily domain-containing protein [Aspergillus welwitschiae]RDH27424.1 major facilitator superfamily domain-containing protein [Aspergillus welwitschiae]